MSCVHHEVITKSGEPGEEIGTCNKCGQVRKYFGWHRTQNGITRDIQLLQEGKPVEEVVTITREQKVMIAREAQQGDIKLVAQKYGVEWKKIRAWIGAYCRKSKLTQEENCSKPQEKAIKPESNVSATSSIHPAFQGLLVFLGPPGRKITITEKEHLKAYFASCLDLVYEAA
jgi:hypothetical protein